MLIGFTQPFMKKDKTKYKENSVRDPIAIYYKL